MRSLWLIVWRRFRPVAIDSRLQLLWLAISGGSMSPAMCPVEFDCSGFRSSWQCESKGPALQLFDKKLITARSPRPWAWLKSVHTSSAILSRKDGWWRLLDCSSINAHFDWLYEGNFGQWKRDFIVLIRRPNFNVSPSSVLHNDSRLTLQIR